MSDRSYREAQAAEAWRRIFGFFTSTRHERDKVLESLGLTPNDARALASLDAAKPRTMRSLADEWGCDASNATWMIDRLERRGLAERGAQPSDRRVKLVVLTSEGVRVKDELMGSMRQPPPELLALETADLEALVAALARLPAGPESDWLHQPRGG